MFGLISKRKCNLLVSEAVNAASSKFEEAMKHDVKVIQGRLNEKNCQWRKRMDLLP